MEVEVISRERIKPSSPTLAHLKTYKISLLDQLFPCAYVPLVFFYLNPETTTSLTDLISERSHTLKQSLAQTLTSFYPFAGKIKDDLYVDCNDNGVYYVEARVNCHLLEILRQPDTRSMHRLLPQDPTLATARMNVVMIQVNFFECGGIALSICSSHKIIDGHTCTTFMKAWARTAQGSSLAHPSFIASSLFPQNCSLPKNSTLILWPKMFNQIKYVTKRFVFDASALARIKAKATSLSFVKNPSRIEALLGLIWKSAMAASKVRQGLQRHSVFSLAVNLRRKSLLPLSEFSVGNLIWSAVAQCTPDVDAAGEEELCCLVGRLRDAVKKINSDFVQELQEFHKVTKCLKELGEVYSNEGVDYFSCTSMCNGGMYEANFGWGRPVWVSLGGAEDPLVMNLIFLMDTKSGGGIEAWVSLSEEEMDVFERDPELLEFALLDPSPIELGNSTNCHARM